MTATLSQSSAITPQVVRDPDHGHTSFRLQVPHQVQKLRLNSHVSAVVGSSAMSSSGSQERAMAIIALCRIPPLNWKG